MTLADFFKTKTASLSEKISNFVLSKVDEQVEIIIAKFRLSLMQMQEAFARTMITLGIFLFGIILLALSGAYLLIDTFSLSRPLSFLIISIILFLIGFMIRR